MPEILVFSEKDVVAFELLAWGKKNKAGLNAGLSALLPGKDAQAKTADYFAYGADKVYLAKTLPDEFYADVYAQAISQILNSYGAGLFLTGSTRRGKELAARVAQKWGAGCVTDAIDLKIKDGELILDRYTLGGNTISSEVIKTARKVVSVMPKTFQVGEREPKRGEVIEVALDVEAPRLKIVERRKKESETVSLDEAENLLCAGRGLAKKEDLALVETLAKSLHAEIGCTRPLSHDLQWLSEEREVGLSGKKCKPRLCLSIGISGQIQHTVGIRDSRLIIAINKDKSAPIFETADYGIVGDLYEVVPKLTEKIQSLKT